MNLVRVLKSKSNWAVLITPVAVLAVSAGLVFSLPAGKSDLWHKPHKHPKVNNDVGPTVIPVVATKNIDKNGIKTSAQVQGISSGALPPAHTGLANSSNSELKKLAQYEQASGGAVASGMMYFTDYPDNVAGAKGYASHMYSTLKEFAKYGITPLIIMEPSNSNGILSFSNYRNGAYDGILDTYFQALKNLGLSDSEMGIWTYFPEANLPEWGPVDVADFAPNITRTVNIQKKYFPSSRASIMLDAESYPAGSTNWSNGSYVSLAPFVSGIPSGLLDSFGLQGFPWVPAANKTGQASSINPGVYLNSSLAADAANRLGVKYIWLNTGSPAAMYTNNPSQIVYFSASQRQAMLNGVLNQALKLKNSGYGVAVNLFSEDKSNTSRAIDWSYKTATDQIVFENFAGQLNANHIDMWLFDN
ncbi:hypothetical protein KW803_03125 [Candidatus Saccharibacteria bacterium]|nr:hypothetical protein [Candidatus Saccharibacteria bacterium]